MVQPINHRLRMAGHLGLRSPDGPLFAHSAPSRGLLDQVDYLASLGFAGVFDSFLKLRTLDEQAALGRRLAELGLEMGTFNNDLENWNKPLWTRSGAEARAAMRESVEGSIAAVRRVGGGAAVCVTGVDPERGKQGQVDAMIENLRLVAPLAEAAGLVLMVEPVAAEWIPGLLVSSLADGVDIVRAVKSPAVRLLFDVGHLAMMGEDVLPTLDATWDLIGGIQVADVPGRIELGAGTLDFPAILGAIADRGFDGLVEVELLTAQDSAEGEANLVRNLRAIDAAMKERNT